MDVFACPKGSPAGRLGCGNRARDRLDESAKQAATRRPGTRRAASEQTAPPPPPRGAVMARPDELAPFPGRVLWLWRRRRAGAVQPRPHGKLPRVTTCADETRRSHAPGPVWLAPAAAAAAVRTEGTPP